MTSENLSSDNAKNAYAEIMADDTPRKMKKGSAIGLSGAWMKTLTGRFLMLSILSVLGYFLFLVLPVLLSLRSPNSIIDYVTLNVNGHNMAVFVMIGYITIAASALTFDYLHSTDSVTGVHSFPVTRGRLFRTTFITGYLLLLIPIIIGALMMYGTGLIAASQAGMISENLGDPAALMSRGYNAVNCVKWFLDTTLVMTFTYAVSTFAGIIAGSVLMHVLLAMMLEGLPVSILFLYFGFRSAFIYGAGDTGILNFTRYLSPTGYLSMREGPLVLAEWPMYALFLGISLFLIILSGVLYKKVKLERERSTTVFPAVGDVLVAVFTFLLMSGFGMVFAAVMGTAGGEVDTIPKMPFVISAGVSGLIFYIILRMIGDGTIKIFNLKNLVKFLVFGCIAAVIFAFSVFDITGIANKVPNAADIDQARIEIEIPFNQEFTLSDEESVKKVVELHELLIGSKKDFSADSYETTSMVKIRYYPKSGLPFAREYNMQIPCVNKAYDEKIAEIMATEEYQEALENRFERVARNSESFNILVNYQTYEVPKDQREDLIKAFLQDFREHGYTGQLKYVGKDTDFLKKGTASIEIEDYSGESEGLFSDGGYNYINLYFGKDYKNTMKFLEDNKHIKKMRELAEESAEEPPEEVEA